MRNGQLISLNKLEKTLLDGLSQSYSLSQMAEVLGVSIHEVYGMRDRLFLKPGAMSYLFMRHMVKIQTELTPLALDTLRDVMANPVAGEVARIAAARVALDAARLMGGNRLELHDNGMLQADNVSSVALPSAADLTDRADQLQAKLDALLARQGDNSPLQVEYVEVTPQPEDEIPPREGW